MYKLSYHAGQVEKSEQFYLKEKNVVLCVGKFVQLGLIHLQLSNLLPDLLQQLFSLTDGRRFLGFNQLPHLKALQFDRPNQFREDGVTLLSCCPSRALEGDPKQHTSDCCGARNYYHYKRMDMVGAYAPK